MKYVPRQYQLDCIDDCISWIKKSVEPAVVEATVSFGKSLVIALLAKKITEMSGKKVLILCPNGTLVKQNRDEVIGIGEPCSVFSASVGSKAMHHPITVGTPQSIKNSLSRFGAQFAAIIIDEGEGLTESVKAICAKIKDANPNVRIIGFTGTPFRTGTGYVYQIDLNGKPVAADMASKPYYAKLIHRTGTKDLMDLGYLTPMIVGAIHVDRYDTSELKVNSLGRFDKSAVDRAYHGHGRATSAIVADIVKQSAGRRGVMIFGATVQHCQEIMASLPPGLSRMITGTTSGNDQIVEDFRNQKFKYLVNRDMMTVGANFPHVDVIAVLRKTESSRLLQQILGRGIRVCKEAWGREEPTTADARKAAIAASPKPNCLYLDYTTDNAETHYPDGDIWSPVIKADIKKEGGDGIECECPDCGGVNTFGARPNPSEYKVDKNGYFVDLAGYRIEVPEVGPMPAHFGRRCLNLVPIGGGKLAQCQYRYTSKECPHCQEPNDIAARYCVSCKGEIVDPNRALDVSFRAMKKDPFQRQTDTVVKWDAKETVSQAGKDQWRIDIVTEYRSFTIWVPKSPRHPDAYAQLELINALNGTIPKTVTYQKEQSGFFRIFAVNKPADVNMADQSLIKALA